MKFDFVLMAGVEGKGGVGKSMIAQIVRDDQRDTRMDGASRASAAFREAGKAKARRRENTLPPQQSASTIAKRNRLGKQVFGNSRAR